ncbi:hypothetical protein NQ317_010386 [Molorchus minor]|uniref:Alpha-carbonic anhydrase domain-containing protein n=1 Tax=Molorchus minor TaxID=1323400 RepID=A0ABQ9IYS5_9CUCU|nr:hypothetical protein NQ317_010386 [Molorchus minor]
MKYAMELQASFVKNCSDTDDVIEAAKCGDLLVMAYLFSVKKFFVQIVITPRDNPYMEPIVNSLHSLKYPMSCVCIEPVILSLLMSTFARDYYYYTGSPHTRLV